MGEVHLGGHDAEDLPSGTLPVDSHGAAVADPVWALFAEVIGRAGPMPTPVEWDNDLPDWPVLAAGRRGGGEILAKGETGLARAS